MNTKQKRYSLVLPQDLFDEIQKVADSNGSTVLDVMRKFIKLGLIAIEVENDPNSELIIRTGDKEQKVIFY